MGTKLNIKENPFHHHQQSVLDMEKSRTVNNSAHANQGFYLPQMQQEGSLQCPMQCLKNNKRVADITMEDSTDITIEDQDFAYLSTLDSLSGNC